MGTPFLHPWANRLEVGRFELAGREVDLELEGLHVKRDDSGLPMAVRERLELDERMLPTGRREPVEIESGPLGERTFDDAFVAPAESEPFVLAGGGRRLELRTGEGYPFAQIYAPLDLETVAFEPMTAPTNALVRGEDLRMLPAGESFTATFSVTLSEVA